jgi:hypothetical protein
MIEGAQPATAMNKPRLQPDERSPAALQQLQRDCSLMAAQMQYPLHQRAAIVDVEGDDLDSLQVEVFTCRDESRQRVCEAVEEILASSM